MSCTEIQSQFDDYLDGELIESARRAVETHVAGCADCRQEIVALQDLLRAARALDPEVPPQRDLWPGISARLASSPSTPSTRTLDWKSVGLAAGLALTAVLLPLWLWWTTRVAPHEGEAQVGGLSGPAASRQAVLARSEDGVMLARADLVAASAELDGLDDETVRVVQESMAVLDRAIGEIRDRLSEDPHNRHLRLRLAACYQQERKLLQRISVG